MNVQEVAAVIAYLGSAWPSAYDSDDTADVWAAELDDIDGADAIVAMRQIVRTSDFPPSIAKFREACIAVARRRRYEAPVNRQLTAGRAPWPAELVAQMRQMALDAGPRKHWHAGPDPCPVCGGLQPPRKGARRQPEPLEKDWCSRCGSHSMPLSVAFAKNAKPVERMTSA